MNDVMGILTRFELVEFLHRRKRMPFKGAERLLEHAVIACDRCHMTLPRGLGALLIFEIVEDLVELSCPCCRHASAAKLDLRDAAVGAAIGRWLDNVCCISGSFTNESQHVSIPNRSFALVAGAGKKGRSRKVPTHFHRPPKARLKLVRADV